MLELGAELESNETTGVRFGSRLCKNQPLHPLCSDPVDDGSFFGCSDSELAVCAIFLGTFSILFLVA
jgi:hypothetical protein